MTPWRSEIKRKLMIARLRSEEQHEKCVSVGLFRFLWVLFFAIRSV